MRVAFQPGRSATFSAAGPVTVLLVLAAGLPIAQAQVDISGVYLAGRAETPCGRSTNFARSEACPINELGLARREAATAENDPGLDCIADGLSRHFTRLPRPVEIIQSDDEIIFHHEYFDVRRIIPIGGEPPRPDTPHTLHGYSLGRWEGEVLVIETSHLVENIHTIQTSPMTTTVERFQWNDDRTRLLLDVEIDDPVYYDGPVRLARAEYVPNPGDYIAEWFCSMDQRELFFGDFDSFFDDAADE